MRVVPVANLKDNYAYLVVCEATGQAAIVDPGEAAPIVEAVRREGVTLTSIWATHHHLDHVGGNPGVIAAFPGIEVIAHAHDHDRVAGLTKAVVDGDEVTVGTCRARIIHNPGHTLGAISYWLEADAAVFTGDTLFAAGCGRIFEGTPPMMFTALDRLAALPPATKVYFGHEYTVSNLVFAATADAGNDAVVTRLADARARRERGEPTTPSTIGDECATNPFLRAGQPGVAALAAQHEQTSERPLDPSDEIAVFAAVRRWKDNFKG